MRNIREEIEWKEERFTLLADKVDKNKMADAETEAELQGLQAGEERRGSNASQAVDYCLDMMVEQVFATGTAQAKSTFVALCEIFVRICETLPRKCKEEKKEEETVNMNKSKAEPVSSWRHPRQAGSVKMHQLDLPRVRGVLGESGSAGRGVKQGGSKERAIQIARTNFCGGRTMTMGGWVP